MKVIHKFVKEYEWVHTSIGIIGNICFVTGSVLFLSKSSGLPVYFFIAGSTGMLVGAVGSAIIGLERVRETRVHRRAMHGARPAAPH
jgi:hypothetical protein